MPGFRLAPFDTRVSALRADVSQRACCVIRLRSGLDKDRGVRS